MKKVLVFILVLLLWVSFLINKKMFVFFTKEGSPGRAFLTTYISKKILNAIYGSNFTKEDSK